MRFVPLDKVRGLEPDKEVFLKFNDGTLGIGKMVEEARSKKGRTVTFEVPQYFNEDQPMINPVLRTDVAQVCVVKEKKEKKEGDTTKTKSSNKKKAAVTAE